jgi:cytochrome c peroxidase
LTTRPDLGDVSQGKLLSIDNYYAIMKGILTPVQMEGLRLLLTPFPQQQFNQTEDRKVKDPSLGYPAWTVMPMAIPTRHFT